MIWARQWSSTLFAVARREHFVLLIWAAGIVAAVVIALAIVPAVRHRHPVVTADRDVVPRITLDAPAARS